MDTKAPPKNHRKSAVMILLFVIGNLIFSQLHIYAFQAMPILALVTLLIHIIALIYFPYKKLIQIK